MGQYSVIGITPDCKSGAYCGCRFKSYLTHQSREKETFDSVGVWCIPFVSNTQVEGWFDSNGVVAHVSLVFWLTKPRPPWAETGRSGEGRACIIDYSPLICRSSSIGRVRVFQTWGCGIMPRLRLHIDFGL